MFPTSSHKRYWMFADESALAEKRNNAHMCYINTHLNKATDSTPLYSHFLTLDEEDVLLAWYRYALCDFCFGFCPGGIPRPVVHTAMAYFNRLYLSHSVMDYHPEDIMLTCVYLACKVDEVNVPLAAFVSRIQGDAQRSTNIVLSNELLIMHHIDYHLIVHSPYRPLEGFFIDVKTRYPQLRNPDRFRSGCISFLDQLLLSPVSLLYTPSQIALAALQHSASRLGENLEEYIKQVLLEGGGCSKENELVLLDALAGVEAVAQKVVSRPEREEVMRLEKKLANCRNPEYDPDSQVFKEKQLEEISLEDAEQQNQAVATES